MKILEQTPDRLVLRHRPFGFWTLGGLFVLAGFLLALSGKNVTLQCDRLQPPQGTCNLTTTQWFQSSSRSLALETVNRATIWASRIQKVNYYSLILQTPTENIAFAGSSSDRTQVEAIAAQINTFLENPGQSTLMVQRDERLNRFLLGALMGAIGGSILMFANTTTCVFDKQQGTVWLNHQSLARTKAITHPLEQIERVRLSKHKARSKGKTTYQYRVVLVLKSYEVLPLTLIYTPHLKSQERLLEEIMAFLATVQPQDSLVADLMSHLPNPSALKEQKAIAQLQAVAKHHPDDADAHYRLGMALYRNQQPQAASESLNRAKVLFAAQNNSQKVMEVQEVLWDLQLDVP
ncbi:hypothetical protein H6G89_18070 [Oscillatoria sp. FACHB-1407]|uniref:hypothetical protein n=1 Tax=Oscillatoria sp. FACHB-1407 TaxID=2692847 RepID=UPI0016822B0C|nr:hypothetical protein [Oscillatoria sp. FACHB-1407]MBD2462949.1 hypothetical protein [Oscillatoria sp. FACHB-1407]